MVISNGRQVLVGPTLPGDLEPREFVETREVYMTVTSTRAGDVGALVNVSVSSLNLRFSSRVNIGVQTFLGTITTPVLYKYTNNDPGLDFETYPWNLYASVFGEGSANTRVVVPWKTLWPDQTASFGN
jgi:hypothetical protein